MEKKGKVITLLVIAAVIIGGGFIAFIILTGQPQTNEGPENEGTVNIYVNSTIYASISTEVEQYKEDAEAQGYTINIIKWSSTNVTRLKLNISTYYSSEEGLIGAILVGKMPYAMARYFESVWNQPLEYPTDLYITDLDGIWTDLDGLSFWDIDLEPSPTPDYAMVGFEHNNGTGDWGPEIWLARIDPYSISEPAYNYIDAIKDFFDRAHNLRHGLLTREHKAMLFIDDTWSYLDWESHFTAYTGAQRVVCKIDAFTTSKYYMDNLTLGSYELIQVLTHSYPTKQIFGPSGSEGQIRYQDVSGNTTTPLFYMMYSCFIGNYTTVNNMGTQYLFNGGSTITVVCSARSGGVDLYKPYYDSLTAGKTFGDSFVNWLQNPEILTYNKAWLYYGMCILGDPLATIKMT